MASGDEGGVLGIIVAGGASPLEGLGAPDDAALTPFAGKYRLLDFSLATLTNSGIRPVYVIAAGAGTALRNHLAGAGRARGDLRRPVIVPLPAGRSPGAGRLARLRHALARARDLVRTHHPETVAVLLADHIVRVDLREVHAVLRSLGADVALPALALPPADARGRDVLRVGDGHRVAGLAPAGRASAAPGTPGLALTWAGDILMRAEALGTVLSAAAKGDTDFVDAMAERLRVVAYDVLERAPGIGTPPTAYWHEPDTLEAYYEAQMDLCTPHPALDLYDPSWPVLPVASGLGPAKVAADRVGRMGHALNSLLADGVIIQGGAAQNAVIGHGVVIDSTAEVLDSILLDGCRIGRGARVRRAIVGAGVVIPEGDEIGYGTVPSVPAQVAASGLVVVPPLAPPLAAAAH
jgi:glucose-1-phosphate adenylyltransferase